MSKLTMVKGPEEGRVQELIKDSVVFGRQATCDVVIPVTSVSREHAFMHKADGLYHLLDKGSRNGTTVNGEKVPSDGQGRALRHGDLIQICEVEYLFEDPSKGPISSPDSEAIDTSSIPDEDENTCVNEILKQTTQQILDTQPAEKLRLLLDITGAFSKTLELDTLLPKIADQMFQLFKQADRCFLIIADDSTPPKLMPKLVKSRKPQDEANARFSRTIVRKCIESGQAFSADDASRSEEVGLSQSVVDFRIRSVMCVPLVGVNGKPFGVVQLDTQDRSKRFTQDDLKLLWGVATQAAIALDNSRLHEQSITEERSRAAMDCDLRLAQQVQFSFLPREEAQVDGYEFKAYYKAAKEVGGDYYGYIPLSGGRMGVTIGDVAGKGVAAALIMAKVSSETRYVLSTEPDLPTAVAKLNDELYPYLDNLQKFVTFEACILDPKSHQWSICNAGHMIPLLIRKTGGPIEDVVHADITGIPLGIMEGMTFENATFTLEPGDQILFYSDGVSESMSANGVAFGMDKMKEVIQSVKDPTPKTLVERLLGAINQHTVGRQYPHDDITIVCCGRKA
ncbi:MAG: SpoIIE family protein phosphatase [Gemmataceae bacterium]